MKSKFDYTIYTDGGCFPNPGVGGWGWVRLNSNGEYVDEGAGDSDYATNNMMELQAVIDSLNHINNPCSVHIVSDSMYVVNGINKWVDKWFRINKEWIANKEMWRDIHDLKRKHDVTASWVKGHSGNEWNEFVDDIANGRVTKLYIDLTGEKPSFDFKKRTKSLDI